MKLSQMPALIQLQSELLQTQELIDASGLITSGESSVGLPSDLGNSQSLLDACDSALEATHKSGQPVVRLLLHFACTGGTLFSKVLAALPNVFLLSEVHANSPLAPASHRFAPSDVALLSRAAGFPDKDKFCDRLMSVSLATSAQWIHARGGSLIIRDHTHSDFCHLIAAKESRLVAICEPLFSDTRPIITIRHPASSYASLERNGWAHFEPEDFTTYCDRYHQFLDAVAEATLIKYEDFVEDPEETLQRVCRHWGLDYSDLALEVFSIFEFSGDSGRKGAEISIRAPTARDMELRQTTTAATYSRLLDRLGYPSG